MAQKNRDAWDATTGRGRAGQPLEEAGRRAIPLRRTARRLGVVAALVALLAACGGGGPDSPDRTDAASNANRMRALATFPNVPIPADAYQRGMWGPLYDWPLVAVHTVLLPDGRVLTYGSRNDGTQTANFEFDIWDNANTPDTGHTQYANNSGTDIFCGSQLVLPPTSTTSAPRVFLAGGDNWTGTTTTNTGNNNSNVIDPQAGTISRGGNMSRARWYSSSITLTNGETLVMGGMGGTDRPEVRGTNGSFRSLTSADTSSKDYFYPRNFVMPDGRIFGFDSNGAMYFVGTDGTGSLADAGNFAGQYASADATAAMFRPGRILQMGGNSNGALVIDVTGGQPVVTPTQSMSVPRRLATATLLPDGHVLATGGSTHWNDPGTAHYTLEFWDPQTGQWTTGPASARPRLYHSNAILLPDASVLVTGGGSLNPNDPALNQLNAQVYYPKYLFTASGQRATRPVISSAPQWLDIGTTFTVQTAGQAPSRVVLIKTGSSTHNFNMEQRFIDLAFTANGGTLSVQAPTRAGEAPPGFYMLFVLDAAGVPSEARMLRIGVAANPNPAVVPVLTAPGNRTATVGTALNLQLQASDPNGDVLGYSTAGLPPGLTINGATGLISGTPTRAGSFNVVVAVSDGVNSATSAFTWTVEAVNGLTLTQEPVPTSSMVGGNVSFSASASGNGLQYQWNFGDGRADTAWSTASNITTSYAAAGTYIVTMRVRDSAGALISRSFLQTVYLPATANAPTASTPILVEPVAGGTPRVWVANPDNDSVTALDASTGARIAEVPVGQSPRTLARAASGALWVVNKGGASISVVDPGTRTVTRTIALPRASRPHGIAMSPVAAQAFVALEATGQLLRYDTASFALTGTVTLGAHVRHVSVSADGGTVWVSRFITPPLPGEATAVVSTPDTAGGELLQINASTLALVRTVILKHSDRLDGENQGRGIPNYLGAAVISPDGSQAYVPGKLDNIKRGQLRDGLPLNFQNTVRAASSRIALTGGQAFTEDLARRVDHDNASLASAVAFDTRGTLMFVALETSREVAVVDAFSGVQWVRFDAGRAPQGLALSSDGRTLYVSNFMDRSVTAHDLRPLLDQGLLSVPLLRTSAAVATERLSAQVLIGKQFFYDARDTRLARDRYMSCASCHNDGAHDGRVWDLTHAGEGLRNTIALRGRAGAQGKLHWSANFDEVQDFEGQIRALAGGTGLMTDPQFGTGTRSQPLGDPKAGVSADLDALAAYVASLNSFELSPLRNADGSLTATAATGKTIFQAQCLGCHGTGAFTVSSATSSLQNIGTLKPSSGQRLGGVLTGIDPPTLRDVWSTAPYLHDGSAPTLGAAITAHNNLSLNADQVNQLTAYVAQIGGEEVDAAPVSTTTYEAERGTFGGGAAVQNAAAASGGQVIGAINLVGAYSQITVNAPVAGNASMVVRFANGYTSNRSLSLYVNGVYQQQLVFVPTGGWNIFANQPAVTFALNAGANTIRLQRDLADVAAADIDSYAITTSTGGTANRPPVVTTPAAQSSTVGTVLSLQVAASDPDGDALTYSATGLPPGLAIAPTTGLITGTPTTAGSYSVVVTVADGKGGSIGAPAFAWTVVAAGGGTTTRYEAEAGTIGGGSAIQNAAAASGGQVIGAINLVGAYSQVVVNAAAAGNATLVIRYANGYTSNRSLGLYVNGVWRQQVVFVPTGGWNNFADQPAITVALAAGSNTLRLQRDLADVASADIDYYAVTTQAAAANRLPTVTTPVAQSSTVGTALSLPVAASDPDGDALTFSATGLPPGLGIGTVTGLIVGTPTTAGTYGVIVTVNDGKGGVASSPAFAWTVSAAPLTNRPPVVTTPAAQASTVGTALSLAVTASDPDGDALSFSASGLPPGLGIGATNGAISGTPTTSGSYSVVVSVSDGRGGVASTAAFAWTVQALSGVTVAREAETGTFGNGARVQTASSASGGRLIGTLNRSGAFTQVTVPATTAGPAVLVVRYSSGYATARTLSLYVNGVRQTQLSFSPTGGWNTFANRAAVTVSLAAGNNTIRLQRDSADSGGADIDLFTLNLP